jgi:hypothetical protein
MTAEQALAVATVLRTALIIRDDPYWHYYCRCCRGRSRSYEVRYQPDLNGHDYPCQHEAGCAVLIVEAMLIAEQP